MQANNIAKKWISQLSGLVSPPDICIKIFELIESQTSTSKQLGDVIGQDPNLSARLLKIANSPYYHFSTKIETISRAISVVGVRELSSLVLAVSAVKTFSNIPAKLVDIDTFWQHSIYTALMAQELAKQSDVLHPERLFVAGLMHDIGSLIIYNRAPEIAAEILAEAQGNEQLVFSREQELLQIDHAYLGGMMLDSWNFPPALRESIKHHHDPENASGAEIEAAILHIADAIANTLDNGRFSSSHNEQLFIKSDAWSKARINRDSLDMEYIINQIDGQFSEMSSFLCG